MGETFRFHLGHDPRAVNLHRPWADSQVVGDHLVRLPADQSVQHLALARREQGQTHCHVVGRRLLLPSLFREFEGPSDAIQDDIVGAGFFDEIHCSRLHGLDRQGHVAVP